MGALFSYFKSIKSDNNDVIPNEQYDFNEENKTLIIKS